VTYPSARAGLATQALLLKSSPYREADRMVVLYTRSHGKITALARSAARSRTRFGASLALFVVGEAFLKEKATSDLWSLERFEARRDFGGALALDVVSLAHASYATELVRELTVPRHEDAKLLDLLVELYGALEVSGPKADTLRAFELHLLGALGLMPVLSRCVACGAQAATEEGGVVVDPDRGGLCCARCAASSRGPGVRPLSSPARARLCELGQVTSLAAAAALPPLAPDLQAQAREAMHALLRTHLSGPLQSLEFLRKLRERA
jgi:DNA repair protein RecO (recombination protein O)